MENAMNRPLTRAEAEQYSTVSKKNIEFLMNRYNKVNRWVIADMLRRSRYHLDRKSVV